MGDLARQVNHDIKNGLIPMRNVFGILAQAAGEGADQLAAAFQDRQATVESSIAYLETLASNYARLYPQPARESCDVNAVVRETVKRVGETGQADLRLELGRLCARSAPNPSSCDAFSRTSSGTRSTAWLRAPATSPSRPAQTEQPAFVSPSLTPAKG